MQHFLLYNQKIFNTAFINASIMDKLIFLPHCLRSTECPAKLASHGYNCINCGRCKIGAFKKTAEEKGYNVFIVPGGSMVKKILEDFDDPEVIGVACQSELKEGNELVKKKKIKAKSLQLSKDGCVNTEVDFDKLYNMLI